eukprot:5965811-Pleurochrysis_carterae.AAC.1
MGRPSVPPHKKRHAPPPSPKKARAPTGSAPKHIRTHPHVAECARASASHLQLRSEGGALGLEARDVLLLAEPRDARALRLALHPLRQLLLLGQRAAQ